MIYGILGAICTAAPIGYLLVCDIKNHNRIKDLQEQVSTLKSNLSKQNDEITYLKNNSEAAIAYKILKDNCKKMGTCHLFRK